MRAGQDGLADGADLGRVLPEGVRERRQVLLGRLKPPREERVGPDEGERLDVAPVGGAHPRLFELAPQGGEGGHDGPGVHGAGTALGRVQILREDTGRVRGNGSPAVRGAAEEFEEPSSPLR